MKKIIGALLITIAIFFICQIEVISKDDGERTDITKIVESRSSQDCSPDTIHDVYVDSINPKIEQIK